MTELKLEKTPMPKLPMDERLKTFREVAQGYTVEMAVEEAERCLQCGKPPCVEGCPLHIEIPKFIKAIKERKFEEAARIIREKNLLPAVCGRVCPQELLCQARCVVGKKGDPLSIGALERFAADYEMEKKIRVVSKPSEVRNVKVAVVGSGPYGLTVAAELGRLGYQVTVFEALHEVGGVLVYGIPEFRLPKNIVRYEAEYIQGLGVEFKLDMVIGRTLTIKELFDAGYDAVFIGTGAGTPQFLGVPEENLNGIYSANEFLIRVNLMKAYLFPEYDTPVKVGRRVVVVGGGNVALDAARTALRLGAEKVTVIYRRSEAEMPARRDEVENAKEEGIEFQFLTNPVRFIGDDEGWVKQVECIRMRLGEPDSSGRRRPIPIEGSEFKLDVETVIIAIGTRVNKLIQLTTPELKVNGKGHIVVDEYGRTSMPNVYAGGDVATGAATVIEAIAAGKKSAMVYHHMKMGKPLSELNV
jgi:glutamate synthase (NADPH/NADH) small chain